MSMARKRLTSKQRDLVRAVERRIAEVTQTSKDSEPCFSCGILEDTMVIRDSSGNSCYGSGWTAARFAQKVLWVFPEAGVVAPNRVWEALANADEKREWTFDGPDFSRSVQEALWKSQA